MTKNSFLEEIIELLDLEDEEINLNTDLNEIEDYDSFAILSLVAFIHKKFNLQFKAKELQEIDTIDGLIKLIGEDKFE